MGAKALFTNEADFSDVSTGSKMHLSHVLIEAFIAVNETGTLAGSGAGEFSIDEVIYYITIYFIYGTNKFAMI